MTFPNIINTNICKDLSSYKDDIYYGSENKY